MPFANTLRPQPGFSGGYLTPRLRQEKCSMMFHVLQSRDRQVQGIVDGTGKSFQEHVRGVCILLAEVDSRHLAQATDGTADRWDTKQAELDIHVTLKQGSKKLWGLPARAQQPFLLCRSYSMAFQIIYPQRQAYIGDVCEHHRLGFNVEVHS